MELPDWLEPYSEEWEGFCEMRKAMKRIPFTDRAMRVTITNLYELLLKGENPGKVLDQSTQRGWRGVFPVAGGKDEPKTFEAIRRETNKAAIRRTVKSYHEMGVNFRGASSQGNKRIGDGDIH